MSECQTSCPDHCAHCSPSSFVRHLDADCSSQPTSTSKVGESRIQQQAKQLQQQAVVGERQPLEARYKELFNVVLPKKAKAQGWPIHLNHCLMRVALDHYCGECWYNRWEQRAGALASMACSDLEGVIGIAEKMGREGGDGSQGFIVEINRKSLEYRRKQQLKPEPPPQRSESGLGGNAEQQNETLQPCHDKRTT